MRVVWGPPLRPSHHADIITEIDGARRTLVVTPVKNGFTTLDAFLDDLRHVDQIIVAGTREQAVIDWIPTAQHRMLGDQASWTCGSLP